jgi:DNA-binding GntR family transcriptional regulator
MSALSNGIDLPHRTIVESLIEKLSQEIRSGAIEPGGRIGQQEIAKRYNVSTSPVREAFSALEREGLLVRTPHRGVVVFQPKVEDLIETYELRIVLERLATERAVPNLTPEALETMRVTAVQMYEDPSPETHFLLNQEFHRTIYGASGSPRLIGLIGGLMADSAAYLRIYGSQHPPEADRRIYDEHMAIYEACREGSAKKAGAAVARHLKSTLAGVRKELRR